MTPTPTSDAPASRGRPLDGRVVLVIEDVPDSLALMAQVLRMAGAIVHEAVDARDALGQLDDGLRPELIVSDIGMPGMDGYQLIETIRGRPIDPQPPAVALTAYARRDDRLRALRAGFQAHLAKPADAEEIVATLASLATLASG